MWKYIGEGKNIAGVPTWDLTDEEFDEIERGYDARFGTTGALRTCQHPADEREAGHACLLFEHVPDKTQKAAAAAESEE